MKEFTNKIGEATAFMRDYLQAIYIISQVSVNFSSAMPKFEKMNSRN